MESKVVKQGEREDGGRRRKASGKGGSKQSRLAWTGDGGGPEEANGMGKCSPMKHICLLYEETPSHGTIPPIVRMARWPKTPGELGNCISAESVRTIKQEKELCL